MLKKLAVLIFSCLFLVSCTGLKERKVDIGLEEDNDIQLVQSESVQLEENSMIQDIVINKQFIFLNDSANNIVQILDKTDYKVIKTLSAQNLNENLWIPSSLYVSEDTLYILDNKQKQIILYNLKDDTYDKIQLNNLDSVMLNTFMSLTVIDEKMYVSLSANNNEANCIYEVATSGQLKKIVNNFIGYVTSIDNSLVATNAYFHSQDKDGIHITTGDSKMIFINEKNQVTSYQLNDKIAPFKLYKLGDFMITSSLGTASIIKYDINNRTSKVIYSMNYTSVENAYIGMLAVDVDNSVYLIDNSNHTLMKLVYHDEKHLYEY
ncbi:MULTISPECIES: hypothetical protein [unclassified Facklamia]|uniref:hypothetical protein n=1 Tax=Aerococcaceae TaxID=186827 RepID=UPI0013B62D8B|nr:MULTISPECIES: hypothetical protein [unclassified Facklamia]NEW65375.1 hypothetical protein [Facklamia sp. 252]NEW68527.1 hypothetical protein [Facklamia sp. 253]QQD64900.1 hypothetical protein JDW14_06075 [Aerococcaceae bacterium zg-252]